MINSVAVKVIISRTWSETSIVMNSFFRVRDSLERWYWVAINMSGSSHIVSISRGVDKESEKNINEVFRLLSQNWLSRGRLRGLIMRLYIVGLIQIILRFESHARGISMVVGIIIFSIVRD